MQVLNHRVAHGLYLLYPLSQAEEHLLLIAEILAWKWKGRYIPFWVAGPLGKISPLLTLRPIGKRETFLILLNWPASSFTVAFLPFFFHFSRSLLPVSWYMMMHSIQTSCAYALDISILGKMLIVQLSMHYLHHGLLPWACHKGWSKYRACNWG